MLRREIVDAGVRMSRFAMALWWRRPDTQVQPDDDERREVSQGVLRRSTVLRLAVYDRAGYACLRTRFPQQELVISSSRLNVCEIRPTFEFSSITDRFFGMYCCATNIAVTVRRISHGINTIGRR